MSRFDLRKKENRNFLEIRHHETKFGNSEPQTVNLLNLGKFSKDCYTRKKTEAREKMDTERMDDWSLERMKEQNPPSVRVQRTV